MRAKALLGLLVAFAVLGQGCSTPLPQTITVRVPISVPCSVPEVPRPELPIDNLVVGDDVWVVSRALWATTDLLESYIIKLQAAISACQ